MSEWQVAFDTQTIAILGRIATAEDAKVCAEAILALAPFLPSPPTEEQS